jgi:hypothetical protein
MRKPAGTLGHVNQRVCSYVTTANENRMEL